MSKWVQPLPAAPGDALPHHGLAAWRLPSECMKHLISHYRFMQGFLICAIRKSTKANMDTSMAKWVQPLPAAPGDALHPTA